MEHMNDLPKRHPNHDLESEAEATFQSLIAKSGIFVLQGSDRKDYGTDCQIEFTEQGRMTNVRIHVQLKGTEQEAKADGSVSISMDRTTVNYLCAQPHSIVVCYHKPSSTMRYCFADDVIRRYERRGDSWTKQKSLTVKFSEELTEESLGVLARLANATASSSKAARYKQFQGTPRDWSRNLRTAVPEVTVPEDKALASALLESLFQNCDDLIISSAFGKFEALLGDDKGSMALCYMAEINVGLDGVDANQPRIEAGLKVFLEDLQTGRYAPGRQHYTIANALTVLGRDQEAMEHYSLALFDLEENGRSQEIAACYKNLGTCFAKLGKNTEAEEMYRRALSHDSQLPEAHFALALCYVKAGRFEEALHHLDQIMFVSWSREKRCSIAGWRTNILFNIGDASGAFREIYNLIGDAKDVDWIWSWCARNVAEFGRCSLENAKRSLHFWQKYLSEHPNSPHGLRESILCQIQVGVEDRDSENLFERCKPQIEKNIEHLKPSECVDELHSRLNSHIAFD
jgi:tetratricopeptide (TPR) repeat protein